MHKRAGKSAGPPPGRLVAGLILADPISLDDIKREIEFTFCRIKLVSGTMPFHWTSYYRKEMGENLTRIFLAFDCLIPQDDLAEMKHRAISLEERWKDAGARRVNIDPGIITAERLVLATTKNFTHRIYISRGIFADLTLIYRKGGFRPLEWTYPDYSEKWSLAFWNEVRQGYLEQLRGKIRQGEADA